MSTPIIEYGEQHNMESVGNTTFMTEILRTETNQLVNYVSINWKDRDLRI